MDILLDSVVKENDVDVIATQHLTDWEGLRSYCNLNHAKEVEIGRTSKEYGLQKRHFLQAWKEQEGDKATYRALITAAEKARKKKLADSVRAMLRKRKEDVDGKLLNPWAVPPTTMVRNPLPFPQRA